VSDAGKKIVKRGEKLADRILEAIEEARSGDATKLNQLYDEVPYLLREIAELYLQAEQSIVRWFGGLGKGPQLHLEAMREDLGYDVSGGLERLLIDRLVVCWLRVQQAERIVTMRDKESLTNKEREPTLRRLEVANKTFLRACKTLAQVRKLMKRDFAQINIAQQQVNIAQMEAGSVASAGEGGYCE